jgi:hypothetical protein
MKIIYSMASEVVVWLGEAADGSDEAFDMLRSVHHGEHRFAAANSGNFDQPIPLSWHSFDYLFVGPYWRRVWIIQEIAVADEIRVCCGSQPVNWNDIETTMEKINSPCVDRFFRGAASRMSNLLQIRNYFKKGQLITLMHALRATQDCQAANRLDKIYAFLGITRDGSILVPLPDYRKSPEEVFTGLTQSMIRMGIPRDLIALQNSFCSLKEILPSWVPEWDKLGDAPRRWQRSVLCDDEFVKGSDKKGSDNDWFKKNGVTFHHLEICLIIRIRT